MKIIKKIDEEQENFTGSNQAIKKTLDALKW